MEFAEFKAWALQLNATLEGKPPALPAWRELLARMEAVEPPAHALVAPEPPRSSVSPAPPIKGPSTPEVEREMTTEEALENARQDEIARRADPEGYRKWQEEAYAAFPDDDCPPPPVDPDMAERLGATATEAVQLLRSKGANRRAGRR